MEAEQIQSKRNLQRDGQFTVTSNTKSFIQMIVASAFAVGSLAVMYAVAGGVNAAGRAVMADTVAFNVFLVADILAFVASFVVATILATGSHVSAKMEYFIRITLWTAAVCFVVIFYATAYVVVPPNQKWNVLCFGGAVAIALALWFKVTYQ